MNRPLEADAVPPLDDLRVRCTPNPRMNRFSDIAARLIAVIAIRVGVRVPTCVMPVPSRIREVRAAMNANGVTASWPHASADQTQSTPRRSASTT